MEERNAIGLSQGGAKTDPPVGGGWYASRRSAPAKVGEADKKENRRRSLRVSGRLRRRVGRDSV